MFKHQNPLYMRLQQLNWCDIKPHQTHSIFNSDLYLAIRCTFYVLGVQKSLGQKPANMIHRIIECVSVRIRIFRLLCQSYHENIFITKWNSITKPQPNHILRHTHTQTHKHTRTHTHSISEQQGTNFLKNITFLIKIHRKRESLHAEIYQFTQFTRPKNK